LSEEPKNTVLPYARQVKVQEATDLPYTGWDWSDRTLWFVVLLVGIPVIAIGLMAIVGAVFAYYWK
jgi:hypothetical protein